MRRDIWKSCRWGGAGVRVLSLLVAVLALAVLWGSGVRAADNFSPEVNVDISDDATGANADVEIEFVVPVPNVNYEAYVTFTPPEFEVAADADLEDGTVVGELTSVPTLGLLNGQCDTALGVTFTLMDATTDTGNSFTYDSATTPIGEATWPGYELVGGLERAVVQYPDFVNDLYPGLTPRARYWGHTFVVAAQTHVAIQFLIFEPGTTLPGIPAFSPSWGYPSVVVLNDPGEPLGPSSITDFCTRLEATTKVNGMAGDISVRTNPCAPGTYTFRAWARGLADADGDGFENEFDTCPFTPNDGDARVFGSGDAGESTKDGIDSACDPDPLEPCDGGEDAGRRVNDCDEDEYWNRQDNCPLVANFDQEDADADGIGDVCDTEGNGPNVVDGPLPVAIVEIPVEITGENVCVIPTEEDGDGDGYDDDVEIEYGSDPDDPDSTPEDAAFDEEFDEDSCTDGVDNDGDGDIDDDDEGCAAAATPTVEASPTPEEGTPTPEVTPTPTVEVEICAPVFPGTYNGLVRIDGQPAASGYEVTASIDGVEWGSAIVSGGRYAMDIPNYMPSEEPCFEAGTITFTLNGMTCTPTADWASGLHTVDLSCAPAAPPVTPTETATPPPATPTVTPVSPPPSGAGGLSGSTPGLPLWALALASWAGLTIVAGLGTLVAVKRR